MFFEGIEGLYKIREHFSGDIKTKAKKLCETKFEFLRWMNDRCYYFHNKEVKIFNDAQKICSEMCGFDNGRLYEPKDLDNFSDIYKLAEQYSKKPKLHLWLGLTDKLKERTFVYNSNGESPKYIAPWGPKQPNGNTIENCLTTFKPNNSDKPLWFDRPCIENDKLDEPGHKFMCEFNVPDQQKDLFGKIFTRFIVRYFHLSI